MKTKLILIFTALFAVAATTNVLNQFEDPSVKITARIIGEDQQPIEGAKVSLGFGNMSVNGVTDVNGVFIGEGRCRGDYGASVTKDGYYFSGLNGPQLTNIINGKWLPWNPTCETTLRTIGKPVALYTKNVRTEIPVIGKACGYDLEAGDWVAPYGKGMKSDLVFVISSKSVTNTQNFDVQGELTFANPLDGLDHVPQAIVKYSSFKWERLAPENGYQPQYRLFYTWWGSQHQQPTQNFKFGGKEWEGYFFRVRTVEQNGKIVSAHYGKIRGGIEIDPRWTSTCTVAFTYYFNPTPNDRNLEWDTKKNLFSGLSSMQTPRDP